MCTSGLQLALQAVGLKNEEVLVPSLTFVGTWTPSYNNAIPHFIDSSLKITERR